MSKRILPATALFAVLLTALTGCAFFQAVKVELNRGEHPVRQTMVQSPEKNYLTEEIPPAHRFRAQA